ncbi:MAG TPA: Bcr/CflA family efflux MFS transporter [Roseiarcus sp.]|nr:Bcr/CflA family efflux MFS transporter [Roseiarcus sp.]
MPRLDIHGLGFTLFLGLLTALPPLAIDMALPSLPLIQADLQAPQTEAAAAIAIFIAGFSSAPIVVGPLADRFGRRAIMGVGLILFTLSAAGAALAPSIQALLAFRLVQGASAGAVGILPRAIIRDLFEGREARLQLAAVSIVFSVAPLVAPSLGAAILFFGSWRLIFAALTGVSALVTLVALALFKESHGAENRRNLKPSTIVAGYRRALTNPACAGFSLLGGLLFGGLFAYVNVSPLLFMEGYGVSQAGFAALFALTASGVIVGSSINAWLIKRHVRAKAVFDVALTLECLTALALLMVGLTGAGSALVDAALVMIFISAFGLVFPNAVHEAIHPLPEIAGLASAVVTTAQMLFGALGGVTAAALYRDASPTAVGAIMSASSLAGAALYAFWLREKVEG